MTEPLPVAVIGCGRMGRLHARVYSQMPSVKLIGVFDANAEAARETAEDYNTAALSMDEILARAKAVTIAVPTTYHLATAEPFLQRGIACLIEKPLAPTSADGRKLVELAAAGKAVLQVGHIERFNPAVRSMLQLHIVPGFLEVTRISPLSFRSTDVGVVLDMMIHDIDIVLQLANSKVTKIDATGVSVIGEAEDVCNARLKFANGCVANLTASRVSSERVRKLRAFLPSRYYSLDYQAQEIRGYRLEERDGERKILPDDLPIVRIEPLRRELEAFVAACTGGVGGVEASAPLVSGAAGRQALATALAVVAAIR